MTVSELPSEYVANAVDRNPPQDLEAERSVLGAMLMSKDAIADAVETVRQDDFYRPAHQKIYGAITDLFTRGEPADTITVADSLTRSGDLANVGGGYYLTTLMSTVPTAASATYYAKIVRDRAILRRLVSAGTRIVQWGNDGEGEVDQLVDRAQAEVFEVTSRRTSEDYLPLSEIMDGAVTEIEGIASRSGEMVGVPTGFTDLDQLTHGLHPGQLVILAARPAIGKALALDTPLPTPRGWTTMGQVQTGDFVLGVDGRPVRVSAVTGVLTNRPCYEVIFSDDSRIVADAQHQWVTQGPDGQAHTSTTEQLASLESVAEQFLPDVTPLLGAESALPVPAYALGSWLAEQDCVGLPEPGDDEQIQMFVSATEMAPGSLPLAALATQSARTAHIPQMYLRASAPDRAALLAGILDRAGIVNADGSIELSCHSRLLAKDVLELLCTLGLHPTALPGIGSGDQPAVPTTLHIETAATLFRVPTKDLLHKERSRALADRPRTIRSIRPVASVPVRCIEVDCQDHLYLAGRTMVPTHNSTLGLDIARAASVKHGLASVIFSLEMSRNEIVMRLLSAEAQIPLHNMRSGNMNDPEWRKIASRQGVLHEAPMFVDDSPNMTMTEIRAKCRRLKQAHDLRLVVVDYLQLMSSGKKVESRQQEVSEFSRSMKLLAKELEVPVIAISQLNRGPETRNDKKPMLSDLRESGSLEQDADMVILIHREDAYDKDSSRVGEADLIVAKHRNGPTDTVTVSFQGHYSRFVDMARE